MNKLLLPVFPLLLISGFSYGQNELGIKSGLNISNARNSDKNDFSNLPDFNAGIVFRLKIKNDLLLNTEALLSNKGFNSLLIPAGTTATHLRYLSFPVLLHYLPTDKIYFQAGPEFNFLVNARMKGKTFNESATDNYNKFDLALTGGVGFRLLKKFNLEARYLFGLSQIRKNEDIFGSYRNRTVQLNLIYLLKSKN